MSQIHGSLSGSYRTKRGSQQQRTQARPAIWKCAEEPLQNDSFGVRWRKSNTLEPRVIGADDKGNHQSSGFFHTTYEVSAGLPFCQLDYSAAHTDCDSLRAIIGVELLHNVLDVDLYGLFRYEESLSYVPIPVSAGDKSQDIHLTGRQTFIGKMLCQTGRHFRGNMLLSGMNLADDSDQIAGGHVLKHIATRSGLKSPLNLDIAFECREHDDTSHRKIRSDGNHRVDAAHIGQSEVHESYVGLKHPKLLDGIRATGCLRDELHVLFIVDYSCDPFLQQGMIIYAEDTNTRVLAHH
jgi:hypothetical protein